MIEVESLLKRYEGAEVDSNAVDGISFRVRPGELVTLLGPSGCGKTTTLRMLAGLERPNRGEIRIGEQPMYSHDQAVYVPANRRPVGMVFQSYAIWPHMTVFENVAYSLQVSRPRPDKRTIRERTYAALEAVGLENYAKRPGTALSGGQQQRAALARALVKEPKVLLLDEPLSNLDAKLRDRMRHWMREVQTRNGLTTVYVTHDQDEALAISDRVLLMDAGRIIESGAPEDVYHRPQREFTAGFVGVSNRLDGAVESGQRVTTPAGSLDCGIDGLARGERVSVFLRPEDITLSREEGPGTWRGRVKLRLFQGAAWDVYVDVAGCELRVRVVDPPAGLSEGEEVFITPDPTRAIVIDEKGVAVGSRQGQIEVAHAG